MSDKMAKSPDDICLVCETTRENHGDKRHQFSEDGQLRELPSGPAPQNTPPKVRPRGGAVKGVDDRATLPNRYHFVALLDVLLGKGILTSQELLYILAGGGNDIPGRPTTESAKD